ncbi:MAG: hypothetical protein BWK79_16710 [Beggiatoa sp. IS2]|nr:MAG: hypothetical protein BWK79_16710 [Beggiatoa sp. IS2]
MSNDFESMAQLEEKIHQLPPHLVVEVDDFISFLLKKYSVTLSNKAPSSSESGESQTLWDVIQSFRATANFEAIGEVDEVFDRIRDRNAERKVDFYE